MDIREYSRFGLARCGGGCREFILCENPAADNAPRLNRAGLAFAVRDTDPCDAAGYHPCFTLHFNLPDTQYADVATGGLGRSVSFHPGTEEFRFGPPTERKDKVRPIDFDLYAAASQGTAEEVRRLVESGANPDVYIPNDLGDGMHVLFRAALNPDVGVPKYLVSLGADPCPHDYWFREPLAYAVRRNTLEAVQYFVSLGNNPHNEDRDGETVLGAAALNPDIRVIDYLLSLGVAADDGADDRTPLYAALTRGTPERMKYFMDRGAELESAMEEGAALAPLANLRFALESGYDPNHRVFGGEALIDGLDDSRKALFMEFGGVPRDPPQS